MYHFETGLKSNDNTYKELFRRHVNDPILTVKDRPYLANSVFNSVVRSFDNKV
ncbi:hypothetical protein [Fonticella tunisiensis]|uniref:Uncharacterized protein n=1 Tax=Fonticella tunisiensis TaxID=1096341 RepID=A0A4R7KC12_9CLOT|nr:hypothetical protein [Fonticella tunisiensis]TDT52026.1 hypothetical protein EDD71_1146 [Fonticella tunisiensis]